MFTKMGDRTTPHAGRTAMKQRGSIELLFDAELKDLSICQKLFLLCGAGCSTFDKERSYIYVRENSIEGNCVLKPCFGCCRSMDVVKVNYFDKPPFKTYGMCAYCGSDGFCVPTDQPKIDVVDNGCLICCQLCCSDKDAVIMPYEKLPFPCCCCVNRTGGCDNCFGFCGVPTGNPKVSYPIYPLVKDAEAFANAAAQASGLKAGEVQMKG